MLNHCEAEKSVIGAMLRSDKAVGEAVERLRPDDFAIRTHREIYDAMLHLALGSRKIDLVTVDEELARRGRLEAIGGGSKLIEIANSVPSTANVGAYINIVLEKANLRRLQIVADRINSDVQAEELNSDQIIEWVEGECSDITTRAQQQDAGWISGTEAAMQAYEAAETNQRAIPTGFSELDEALCGGLIKPELTIVGARPGKGKSAFLLAASMAAVQAGYHVGYFSLEMSAMQIGQRALASTSFVSITKQRRGIKGLSDNDWEALSTGLTRLEQLGMESRFHIYQSYGLTIERLGNIARYAVRRGEMDLLVLDYIQLLRTVERTHAEHERLGIISKGLKQLALALDIPILTAAQVRRQTSDDVRRGGRAPTLDELRGSGDLEQDADNVLLVHIPTDPDDPTLKKVDPKHQGIWERSLNAIGSPFTIEVAKHRQGQTARTWCLFKPMTMRFYDDV